MYYRQKVLLRLMQLLSKLLSETGIEKIEKIKLQKLLFLFCQRQSIPTFHFVPYRYGCFSFQAAKDLGVLEKRYALLKEADHEWILSATVVSCELRLKADDEAFALEICRTFAQRDTAAIINYVYDRYPEYSIYSNRVMSRSQRLAMLRERKKREAENEPLLFTIGYEGRDIDAYLHLLVKRNIHLLCDVRRNPFSMKYGFSKQQLSKYCSNLHIAYSHIPKLGIASQKRRGLKQLSDYEALFMEYGKELPKHKDLIDSLLDLIRKHKRIALTCFERHHAHCHRHLISDYLSEKNGVPCQHL